MNEGQAMIEPATMSEEHVWNYLDGLAKPRRSLGKLEELAARLALIQRTLKPVVKPRRLVLFAGDHGVVARGVSAWPSEVTGLMVATMLIGRASSTALAAIHDCGVRLVDVGVATPLPKSPPPFFRNARVANGTRDLSIEPAMTSSEFNAAWQVGVDEADRAVCEGNRILIAGEMGIGNTTPAACLTSLLANVSPDVATGRGAGSDDDTLRLKRGIVANAVRERPSIEALAGFEIVAMAGFYAEGARQGATILLDGYVTTAAALIAEHLKPGTTRSMIAAHKSAEPGHAAALAHLQLQPLIDWQMRLGEGTGALLALPLIDSAVALLTNVASLSELGVGRED
jgi:nicotinate-nucleotide--dimethylbenzimidazole phosphoribosyltransferase